MTDDAITAGTEGGGLWGNASQWTWDWRQNPAGKAVSYVTPPLTSNTAVIGAGAVHLWVRSPSAQREMECIRGERRHTCRCSMTSSRHDDRWRSRVVQLFS